MSRLKPLLHFTLASIHWSLFQRLLDIRDDVIYVLDTDGEPDEIRRNARGELLFFRELLMGGRCRVNGQRLRIPDVCKVGYEL